MFSQVRCEFGNKKLIAGNCESDATRNEPCTETRRNAFSGIQYYSVKLRLRQINVLGDVSRGVCLASLCAHEQQRRLAEPSLEESVQTGQKDGKLLVPTPILQADTPLKNGFEVTFEPRPILVPIRHYLRVV